VRFTVISVHSARLITTGMVLGVSIVGMIFTRIKELHQWRGASRESLVLNLIISLYMVNA